MKKRMMLYFGSFDPIHKGHVALAEYVIDEGLCDETALVVSPQNPFKTDTLQTDEMPRSPAPTRNTPSAYVRRW